MIEVCVCVIPVGIIGGILRCTRRVGGDMIMTDNWVEGLLHPSKTVDVIVQIACAAGVLVVGMLMRKRRI